MKNLSKIFILVALLMSVSLPAAAQFRFGVRAGMAVNKLHFNKDLGNSDNRTGFTGGFTGEVSVPLVGLCVDAALLYANRGAGDVSRDYLDIPLHLKYKFGLPIVGRIVKPFLFTGPDFSFLLSKKNVEDAFENKRFDTAWDLGAGVELINHLQIGASYGFALSNSASGGDAKAKNRCWTVTASWYF